MNVGSLIRGPVAGAARRRAGASVTGVDLKRSALDFARARFADPGVDFLELDGLEALPPGPFDVVVLSNVIEHLEGRAELLRRIVAELEAAGLEPTEVESRWGELRVQARPAADG